MVGETGWQLSHGESSRVYVARALLQGARLAILDESLGALDPETLETVLDCLSRRTESLLVVASMSRNPRHEAYGFGSRFERASALNVLRWHTGTMSQNP